MKKMTVILILVLVIPIVTVLVIGRVFYPDNIAETAPDGGTKDLKTRYYKTDVETAEKTIREIIPTLSTYGRNWKITASEDSQDGQKIIKTEIPVVVFTDDLQVMLKKRTEEGLTQVDVRSASRVGKSDFGENRRHVQQILNALDKQFSAEK